MVDKKTYFTPSTNLNDDIGNKRLLDNIRVTKQIVSTIGLYSKPEQRSNNSAVSIVGPYGSGKSTTALVLYHYLTNSLSRDLEEEINGVAARQAADIDLYRGPSALIAGEPHHFIPRVVTGGIPIYTSEVNIPL